MQRLTLLMIALLAIVSTGCGYTRVGPGHVGIVVNSAGTNKGVLDTPARTGAVWYNPLTETVIEYPTFIQTAKWTRDMNEGNPVDESVTFTNRDSMVINADVSLSYSLVPEKVPQFYVKFVVEDLDKFTHGFLRNVARDCFNEHAGAFTIEQIMGDNAQFLKEARDCTQAKVKDYGVNIEQFGIIGAPRPPQTVIDAINSKAKAQQLALQKQNELVQVEADAKKQVTQAKADAEANVTIARGESEANALRQRSLTKELLEQMRIEKWDGKLPVTVLGDKSIPMVATP
jgi:regulator of protease activity HflC (stomatin/prohibitin superfamily)